MDKLSVEVTLEAPPLNFDPYVIPSVSLDAPGRFSDDIVHLDAMFAVAPTAEVPSTPISVIAGPKHHEKTFAPTQLARFQSISVIRPGSVSNCRTNILIQAVLA